MYVISTLPRECYKCGKCPSHCRCNDEYCDCSFLKARFGERVPPGHSPKCQSRTLFVDKQRHPA
jgi:hypothetical protein